MKGNRLIIALVVLVGLGTAVGLTVGSRESKTTVDKPNVTLPTIKKEDISAVEIHKANTPVIKLEKKNGADWMLTAPVEAKADAAAVESVLDKIRELQITGVVTTRKDMHEKLQVDAEHGIRVKVSAQGKEVFDFTVGAAKTAGTMVRIEGKDEVLSALGAIRYAFDKEPKNFRDRVITDIETKELASVVVESAKGTFRFEKPADKWQLAPGQKPIAKFSDGKVQSFASTVSRMRAADFGEGTQSAEALGFDKPVSRITLTKQNADVVVVELGKEHENGRETYVRVAGIPTVFRISKYTAERMTPDASAFQEDEKKEGEPAEPDMQAAAGGPGGQQLPPEVMEKLRQQMMQQQGPH